VAKCGQFIRGGQFIRAAEELQAAIELQQQSCQFNRAASSSELAAFCHML
jgi:hypothetical protein